MERVDFQYSINPGTPTKSVKYPLKHKFLMGIEIKVAVLLIFLIVHIVAHYKNWYYKYERIDMLTHFLGGLALGAFIKSYEVSIALIIAWEAMEHLLITEKRQAFREDPLNKLSDLFFGILGFIFGFDFF